MGAKLKIVTLEDQISLLRTQEIHLENMLATTYKARKALEEQGQFSASAPSGASVLSLEQKANLISGRNKHVFRNRK